MYVTKSRLFSTQGSSFMFFFYNLLEIPFLEMPAYFHALPSYKSKVQERTVPSRRTQSDAQRCRGASHCRVGLTFPSDAP